MKKYDIKCRNGYALSKFKKETMSSDDYKLKPFLNAVMKKGILDNFDTYLRKEESDTE